MKAKLNYPVRITENVTRISPSKAAKSGWLIVLEREAEATKFISSSTSIPIPEVYGIQQSIDHPEKGELIMEFIPGDPLHVAWPKLTEEQQASVISQLRSYIEEMRTLPQPHLGWIESCSGGPAMDHRVGDGFTFGPLSSESEFIELLMSESKLDTHKNTKSGGRSFETTIRLCFRMPTCTRNTYSLTLRQKRSTVSLTGRWPGSGPSTGSTIRRFMVVHPIRSGETAPRKSWSVTMRSVYMIGQ